MVSRPYLSRFTSSGRLKLKSLYESNLDAFFVELAQAGYPEIACREFMLLFPIAWENKKTRRAKRAYYTGLWEEALILRTKKPEDPFLDLFHPQKELTKKPGKTKKS